MGTRSEFKFIIAGTARYMQEMPRKDLLNEKLYEIISSDNIFTLDVGGEFRFDQAIELYKNKNSI